MSAIFFANLASLNLGLVIEATDGLKIGNLGLMFFLKYPFFPLLIIAVMQSSRKFQNLE